MFRNLILRIFLLLAATPAWAFCSGDDLRTTLTASERAELSDALRGEPFVNGNHWRATRGDQVIHLIGTMHLSDPRFEKHVETLSPMIESADVLFLEMTREDEAALQTRIASDSSLLILPDTSLPELLSEDEWGKMADALRARGMPPFFAARFQPWYVSILLAIPPCASAEDLARGGLDARLEKVARDAGVPRLALENAETIFSAFATQPREMQIQMMLSALVDAKQSEDMFATLVASYFSEAHAEGWHVSALLAKRYSPIEATASEDILNMVNQTLLVDRNRAWIPVLLEAAQTQKTIVAAFGAAHLSGSTGVPALLEQEGFVLERLLF